MKAIVGLYWDLCCLRLGPERMPLSRGLLAFTLTIWLLMQLPGALLQTRLPWWQSFLGQTLALAVLAGITVFLLWFKGRISRWVQTLIALVAVDLVLSMLQVPVLFLHTILPEAHKTIWYQTLVFVLICWELAVQGLIFRRALEVGPFLGVALAMTILVLAILLNMMIFPGALP